MVDIATPTTARKTEDFTPTQVSLVRTSLGIVDIENTPDGISLTTNFDWDQLGVMYNMPESFTYGSPIDKLDINRIVVASMLTTDLFVYEFNEITNTWAKIGSTFTVPSNIVDVTVLKTNRILLLTLNGAQVDFYIYDFNGTTWDFVLSQLNEDQSNNHSTRLTDITFATIIGPTINHWTVNEGSGTIVKTTTSTSPLLGFTYGIASINSTDVIVSTYFSPNYVKKIMLYRLISTVWTLISEFNIQPEHDGIASLDNNKFIVSSARPSELIISSFEIIDDNIEILYNDVIINTPNLWDSKEKGLCALLPNMIVYVGSVNNNETYTFKLASVEKLSIKKSGIDITAMSESALTAIKTYRGVLSATPTKAQFETILGSAGLNSNNFKAIVIDTTDDDTYFVTACNYSYYYQKLTKAL